MAEAEVSDAKIREALKLLDTDHKELELRRAGLLAYLKVKEGNQGLERQKKVLAKEVEDLKHTLEQTKAQHIEEWNKREMEYKQRSADLEVTQQKQRDANQKELAGLKASITKAKNLLAETEKEAERKMAAADEQARKREADYDKLATELDKEIRAKRDRIAVLDEEFRSLAQKHGLGSAIPA